jgi:2',3'-cyclic-nucleotide 2'-phosphodiesterase/3'-nucleotidase
MFSDLGMDVCALGNHEFDWGLDILDNVTMKGASYGNICANLRYAETGERVYPAYEIIEKGGVRFAVIGGILNGAGPIILASMWKGMRFTNLEDEVYDVARQIKENNEADVIIGMLHTGDLGSVAARCKGYVDILFGGHTHSTATGSSNGIPAYNANSGGNGYIHVQITKNADGSFTMPTPKSSDYVALNNANGFTGANPVTDPRVMAIVAEAQAQVAPISGEVIGHADARLTRSPYLQNWATDAMLAATGADAAFVNSGGLRIDVPAGDVTVATMWQFMPFDNTIYLIKTNKAGLKTILEQSASSWLPMSGIHYYYSSSRPSGNRVWNITRADGSYISASEVLTLAVPDFVATGGDNYTAFKPLGGDDPENDSHILLRDVFINNLRQNAGKDMGAISDSASRRTNAPPAQDAARLREAIAKGEALKEADYAAGLWESVAAALAAAKSAEGDPTATQLALDDAADALLSAIEALAPSVGNPELVLSLSKSYVRKGDYFDVGVSLKEQLSSNAAEASLSFNKDVFEYAGYADEDGAPQVLDWESGDGAARLTLMIPNYDAKDLVTVRMRAKEDAILQNRDEIISVTVRLALRAEDGSKSIVEAESGVAIGGVGSLPGDVNGDGALDIIDLSDMIDAFGIDSSHPQWAERYRFMDYLGKGVIDIENIVFVARTVGSGTVANKAA